MKAATIALLLLLSVPAVAAAAAPTAPGGPGATADWTEADKDGYGTSARSASKVWHTLDDGRLTEVFYPDLQTPSVRTLEFVVSDGKTFAQRDSDAANRRIELLDSRSLTYRQVNVQPGRFRVTKTYVTDSARNVLLVNVRFRSLTGKRLQLHALYDPSLGNDAMDDSGRSSRKALLATEADAAAQRERERSASEEGGEDEARGDWLSVRAGRGPGRAEPDQHGPKQGPSGTRQQQHESNERRPGHHARVKPAR